DRAIEFYSERVASAPGHDAETDKEERHDNDRGPLQRLAVPIVTGAIEQKDDGKSRSCNKKTCQPRLVGKSGSSDGDLFDSGQNGARLRRSALRQQRVNRGFQIVSHGTKMVAGPVEAQRQARPGNQGENESPRSLHAIESDLILCAARGC